MNPIENGEFKLTLTRKQGQMFLDLNDFKKAYFEALGGGGKGGGKSNLLCKWSFYWTYFLIDHFKLKKSHNPPIVGFIGRKRASDLQTSTLQTWKKEIPSELYQINQQKNLITIENTASILYGGFDDRKAIDKFNSMELAFAAIDQCEELRREEIGSVRGSLRLKLNGRQAPFRLFLSCNPPITDDPDYGWLKEEFLDSTLEDKKFYKFLWKDNPYIAQGYEKTLQSAYGFNPDLYSALAEGNWDKIGAANLVIHRKYVEPLIDYEVVLAEQKQTRITSADISEEGGKDETVIYDWHNARIVDQEFYCHKDLMDTCGRLVAHAKKNGSNMIALDKIGSGAGVYSRLCEIYANDPSMKIRGFDSRESPPLGIDDDTYANYRAYAYFNASKNFIKESKCTIPNDKKLISQLCSIPFKFNSSGKYLIIPKEEMAGGSPDRADAFVIGLDAIQYADPVSIDLGRIENNYSVNPRFNPQRSVYGSLSRNYSYAR